jgi:hypothetical protein
MNKQWWIFEGETSIDCALFAEKVTVFIEGKRTEPDLTSSTEWYPKRNQVFRNLDCLQEFREKADRYYVLLIVEDGSPTHAPAASLDLSDVPARESWPHLDERKVSDLRNHYLGFTTWQRLAISFGLLLPQTTQEAAMIRL